MKSELSGKFEDLVVALMTPTYDFLAKEIYNAVAGIGTDEETIIEIICTASNAEINNIKMAYHKCKFYLYIMFCYILCNNLNFIILLVFGNDLEKELMGETSGSFRRLLVSLCQVCFICIKFFFDNII